MSPLQPVIDQLSHEIAAASAAWGRRVGVAALGVTDRAGELPLAPAGCAVSPNGACRLFRAADVWMALNLARPEDVELVPAWLECDGGPDAWSLISEHARDRSGSVLVERARLLSLPACRVGEAVGAGLEPAVLRRPDWLPGNARPAPRVIDLSGLWAGPLCGCVLAAAGAEVTRVDSIRRPDPSREATPAFFHRLNGAKRTVRLDLATPDDRARLLDLIQDADVVITSARRRGLASIGLDPEALLASRPGLTWVTVTGYGLSNDRVAFGDDAAAAGGLVGWTTTGEPGFLGDALADPVTGLAAAAAALCAVAEGGGVLLDCAMSHLSAGAAKLCAERTLA